MAGILWAVPFGILSVLIGQLGNRLRGDTLLYIAGFVAMGIRFSIGRGYAERPLQGALRNAIVVLALIVLVFVRTR